MQLADIERFLGSLVKLSGTHTAGAVRVYKAVFGALVEARNATARLLGVDAVPLATDALLHHVEAQVRWTGWHTGADRSCSAMQQKMR